MGRKYKPPETDRLCDALGCEKKGPYKAPRPRGEAGWYGFCLEHVREYNANWDWFKGMSADQIEAAQRDATTWERKTWARQISPSAAARFFGLSGLKSDSTLKGVGAFSDQTAGDSDFSHCQESHAKPAPKLAPKLQRAFKALGLSADADKETIRSQYRALVKANHPDVSQPSQQDSRPVKGGDAIKAITAAYSELRKSGYV